jgi:F-type H+-transporting ATPase subunit epsilon
MSINIRVIAPDRTVFDTQVEEVILPSSTGQLGILKNHAPLLSALDIGVMRVKIDGKSVPVYLNGGFAEIENNQLIVLVNSAEKGSNIDQNVAQQDLEAATVMVNQAVTNKEKLDATQAIRKAKARLQAATFTN